MVRCCFAAKGSVNDRVGDDDDSDDDVEAKRENCTRWLMSTETAFILFFFSEEFLRFSRDHMRDLSTFSARGDDDDDDAMLKSQAFFSGHY